MPTDPLNSLHLSQEQPPAPVQASCATAGLVLAEHALLPREKKQAGHHEENIIVGCLRTWAVEAIMGAAVKLTVSVRITIRTSRQQR